MLTWREYEFCRLMASGEDKILSMKKAFNFSRREAYDAVDSVTSRADIQSMLDFLTGEMGKFDDERTRIVRLRQEAYDLAQDKDLKASERAAMMQQYMKLTAELKKQEAREEQASEDVDALLRDLQKATKETSNDEGQGAEEQGDEEGRDEGEGEELLGASVIEEAMFRG